MSAADGSSSSSPHSRLSGLRVDDLLAQGLQPDLPNPDAPIDVPGCEIEGLLGRGGMGTVYLARQLSLNREVAVKVLAGEIAHDPLFLERLEREAHTMARLRHPNIVTVHDFQRLGNGTAAVVMEYIEGGSLRERLDAQRKGLPVDEALRLFYQVAAGVAAAHAAGVIHRDIKPENVLVDRAGRAQVTDFGLAMPIHLPTTRLTLTGTAVGTVEYMAPEQMRGGALDARSDVFALGVLLYEMLTGQTPRGSFDPPHKLRPEVPRHIGSAIAKALRPRPEDRYEKIEDFVLALSSERSSRHRRPWTMLVASACFVAALGWAALMVFNESDDAASATTSAAPAAAPPPPSTLAVTAAPSPPAIPAPTTSVIAATPVLEPGPWRDALAGINIHADNYGGDWKIEGTGVVSNDGICILSLLKRMPDAYDVRMAFTRLPGADSVTLFVRAHDSIASCELDSWRLGLAGVQLIKNESLQAGYGFRFPLQNGRRYELLVEVRPAHIRMFVDGQLKKDFVLQPNDYFRPPDPWDWNPAEKPTALALGSYQSPTRFELVEWRAVPDGSP